MRDEEFILKKRGNVFFFLDEETGIIGEGININNAYSDLIKKRKLSKTKENFRNKY